MSTTRQVLYAILRKHVDKQTPADRAKTMTSSGTPAYIVPKTMTNGERMACCSVRKPCPVHAEVNA